jgi:hypothetical protein
MCAIQFPNRISAATRNMTKCPGNYPYLNHRWPASVPVAFVKNANVTFSLISIVEVGEDSNKRCNLIELILGWTTGWRRLWCRSRLTTFHVILF